MVLRQAGLLIGAAALRFTAASNRGELGYWIGRPYWGQGFASEAAGAMVQYAFTGRGLHRVYAHHMIGNPASGRVLRKAGMRQEGVLRQHFRKDGMFHDVVVYGLLREEWSSMGSSAR